MSTSGCGLAPRPGRWHIDRVLADGRVEIIRAIFVRVSQAVPYVASFERKILKRTDAEAIISNDPEWGEPRRRP